MTPNLPLRGKTAFITGASMGIGAATAHKLISLGASVFLFARNTEKLAALKSDLESTISKNNAPGSVHIYTGDVRSYEACRSAVQDALEKMQRIDILVNNAGLAIGAPAKFWEMDMEMIDQMNDTNIKGTMNITHAVLSLAMIPSSPSGRNVGTGTIINISSITGLTAPPFPGEAVYHTNKAGLEGFSNSLRNELSGTDVKVLVVRPGCVATHFHEQRVGYDKKAYDEFFEGYTPLISEDVAEAVAMVLMTPGRVSLTAIDVVPTAQRSLMVVDREWNGRHEEGVQGDNVWLKE